MELLHGCLTPVEEEGVVGAEVHRSHHPVLVDVEDVDAARRLLDVPEKYPGAGEGPAEQCPVHRAMEDQQGAIPPCLVAEPLQRGKHPVEELPDALPSEEGRRLGHGTAEGAEKALLEPTWRKVSQLSRTELGELGPALNVRRATAALENATHRLQRSWEPTADDAVELHPR